MQDKLIFREMLHEIKELAYKKDNTLNIEEVKAFFSNAALSEEHLSMVLDYLAAQRVHIAGYDKRKPLSVDQNEPGNGKETSQISKSGENIIDIESKTGESTIAQEREYTFHNYEEELKNIEPAARLKEEQLYLRAAEGDSLSKSRLIELHLKTVIDLVKEVNSKSVLTSDLIQEGNIGLMLAMDNLPDTGSVPQYRDFVRNCIMDAIQTAITEEEELKFAEEQMTQKINYLCEAIRNLEEDLEKKVSLEELAVYLEMPEEEIIDILRMAGDEIDLEEHVHPGEDAGNHHCRE